MTINAFAIPSADDMALTREDVKHLRRADDLCFDWRSTPEPSAGIRVIERAATTGYAEDATYNIRCGLRVTDYNVDHTGLDSDRACAFEMQHAIRFNETTRTFVEFVRPGDVLELHWAADIYGPTSSIRQAGLHADQLDIRIHRGNRSYTFIIAVRMGADDTARMIRSKLTRY